MERRSPGCKDSRRFKRGINPVGWCFFACGIVPPLRSALGGDCVEDMQRLRDDGLSGILGYRPPAPETARQWLDRFYDEFLMVPPLQGVSYYVSPHS